MDGYDDDNAKTGGDTLIDSTQAIRLTGSILGAQRLYLFFFHSSDEEYLHYEK